MTANERKNCLRACFLAGIAFILLAGCCSRPASPEPIIDNLQQQQNQSSIIVERIETETIKLVHDLQTINAPPEIIERATVVYKDSVELKASLEKERALTKTLRIRVENLAEQNKKLEKEIITLKKWRLILAGCLCGAIAILFIVLYMVIKH